MENDTWIQTTRQRIDAVNARIDNLLSTLQWDRNDLKRWHAEQQQKGTYPHDQTRHGVSLDKLETSSKKISSKRRSEKMLPSSARYFYTHAPYVLSFSDQQPVQGGAHVYPMIPAPIPTTDYASLAKAIRAQHGLPAPRVYVGQVEEMEESKDLPGPMKTQKETDAGQRDYKRRRKAYRVKMTKHRSPTEIQRQLVQAYMQEL